MPNLPVHCYKCDKIGHIRVECLPLAIKVPVTSPTGKQITPLPLSITKVAGVSKIGKKRTRWKIETRNNGKQSEGKREKENC